MSFYLGFLKKNTKDVVVFRSIKIPKAGDFRYFTGVMGPYSSEREAKKSLSAMRGGGYRENPGKSYHDRKFLQYIKELEKYKVGSKIYIVTLAKAYEHLESAKDS